MFTRPRSQCTRPTANDVKVEVRDGREFVVTRLPDDPAITAERDSSFQKHRKRGKRRPRKNRRRAKG